MTLSRLLTLLLLLSGSFAHSQVVINEYSCANMGGVVDNYGAFPDWVELYNTSGSAVDLSGWYLSDKAGNPLKYQIGTISIPANGYLMVYGTGRNEISGGNIHTNFKLHQTRPETVTLSNSAGVVVDQFQLVSTQASHSYGRNPDGGATWGVMDNPTPNASNAGFKSYATMPSLSVAAGYHASSVSVNVTSPDANVTLHYTTDGTTPTAASTVVSGPINIATTTVLRAIAISSDPNVLPSFVETNTYFIGQTHSVAILSISGDGLADLLENGNQFEPVGHIEYFGPNGVLRDEGHGEYNEHGNDSWAYDQRGFDFIMRDQHGYNHAINYPIFRTKNRDEYQKLIVKAAASDNYPFEDGGAHIRDAYVQSLSHEGDLKLDERTYEPCIVYLDGRYWGVYEIREKVDDNDFIEHYYQQEEPYGGSPHHIWFLKTWGGTWQEYGSPLAQPAWDALRTFVQGNDMGIAANFNYVDSLYNWQSMVDYFVLNSVIVSKDWLNWNTAWWRGTDTTGDKKRWRYTLWDMDACFGHYVNFTGIPDDSPNADPCNVENLPDPGGQGHATIINKLISENEDVANYYTSRYIDLNNTVFSCDNMIAHLDSLVALIAPEMPGQIARWGGTMQEWQDNVQEIRDFINTRCTAIQQGLVDCYDLSGPFDLTFEVEPVGTGEIKVNSIWLPQYPFTGTYYGQIDILLDAKPIDGWVFDHWELPDSSNLSYNSNIDSNRVQITQAQTVVAHFRPDGFLNAHIPQAFSPNADGHNDWLFVIAGVDIASFDWKIYNRWGELMFSSTDPNVGWDGKFNGELVNAGVYTYTLKVNFVDGNQENRSGNVTVVR